jgi:autotransporter-associated beta strand protein
MSARIDSGSLTVGGTLTVALNNGGRWSVLDVNGGTLTVTNETTGIALGGSFAGNALLLVRAGTATAGIIGLGNAAQTNGDTAVVNMTGGSLYLGSGGIVQVSSNVTPVITLNGGLLGAAADWSCSNNIVLGSPTIQAADALNAAHNIALSGVLSGTSLTKTGAGTLTLSGANTYSGTTTIANGTLALSASGLITNSSRVAIGAGATFDVSSLGGYTFTGVNPAQTLAGNSTSGAGNILAGGTVTLSSGAGTLFQANGTGSTVGKVSVAGNVTLNNNTVTINVTGATLGGGTNRLLDCTGTLTGSANITPVFTGLGLASGATASVVTTPGSNGHVDLVVGNGSLIPTQSAHIIGFNLAGNNVLLNGTNGQSGGTYYLLTSTNIAQPISQWRSASTNVITTNGASGAFTFTGTNVVSPNAGQQYYILSNTNNH